MAALAEVLVRLRGRAGYDSARSFFKGRGGQRHFGCTYRQYVNVERGRSVPGPRLAEKIAIGLRLLEDRETAVEFLSAYLLAVTRSPELVALIQAAFSPALPGLGQAQPPLLASMARSVEMDTKVLTREQSDFISAKEENFWPFAVLANDQGPWGLAELAAAAGIKPAAAARVLERLRSFGIAVRDDQGRWSIPRVEHSVFRHPSDQIFGGPTPIFRLWEKAAASSSESILRKGYFLRAHDPEIRQYAPYLLQALKGATVCSTTRKGPDTAFFLVRVLIDKLRPF